MYSKSIEDNLFCLSYSCSKQSLTIYITPINYQQWNYDKISKYSAVTDFF